MRVGIRTQVLATLLAVLVFGLVASYLVTSRVTRGVVLDARVSQAKEVATLAAARFSGIPRTPEALGTALEEVRALVAPDWVWLLDAEGIALSSEDDAKADPALVASLAGVVAQHRVVEADRGESQLIVVAPVRVSAKERDEEGSNEPAPELRKLSLVWLSDITPTLDQVRQLEGLFILFSTIIVVLSVLLGYVLLGRSVVQPVQRLVRRIDRFEAGEGAAKRSGRLPSGELGDLTQSFERLATRLAEDRSRIERQLSELTFANREIASQQEQLVRTGKLASVGELAAGVAHEIGNPIAVIQGYLEMLSDPELPPETLQSYLRIMDDSIERVSTIIRDLLDFARPVSEQDPGGDAVASLKTVHKLLAHQKRLRHVEFQVESEAERAAVSIPSGRLEQVLINLVFNAADATPEGGEVHLSATLSDASVQIEVSDTGSGISPEDQERIFDPFFTTKDPGEGTGLGLSICHSLIESYGGKIEFESRAGEGTRFLLTLPLRASPQLEGRNP